MTSNNITEIENEKLPNQKPIKGKMQKYIPGILEGLSSRNGMIYTLIGSGGSGKTSLLLNFFQIHKIL